VPRTRPPYPAAFRAEAVELARTGGKTIPELAKDLGVSGQTLRNWVRQADVDAGHGRPGELTTAEQQELRRLRRENQVLRQEREILKKAAAFFAKRRPGEPLPVHRGGEGNLPGQPAVPGPGRLPRQLLRLAPARPLRASTGRPATAAADQQDPPGLARHLWRPTRPRRAPRRLRGAGRPQAGRPADAGGRAGRLPPAPPPRPDPPRPGCDPGTWSAGCSTRAHPTGPGSPTSATSPPSRAGWTWPRSWTAAPARWSAGPWPIISAPS
jgi:transposase